MDEKKKLDCLIQAAVNMECAYRALMAAGQELLASDAELKRLNRLLRQVRELEIDVMYNVVQVHDMKGDK